eukprot:jgi/Picsp_1/681/NSC_00675-R1_u1 small nuclear ribonucleoprotein c protein
MRYYCDYCDAYLTHDSPLVRRQHNSGFKHKANVKAYYLQYEEEAQMRLMAELNGFEMMPPPGMMMGGPRPPPGMYGPGGPGGPIAGGGPVPALSRGPVAAPPRGPIYGQTMASGYPGHGGPPQQQPPPGQ